MLRTPCLSALVLLVLLLSAESRAATIFASTQACYSNGVAQDCRNSPAVPGPDAMSNISELWSGSSGAFHGEAVMAVADFDRWGAHARGSIEFSEPTGAPFVFHGVGGVAFADLVDTFLVGGTGVGRLRMQWSITGANDIGYVASNNTIAIAARTSLNLNCFAEAGGSFLNCADPQFIWTTGGAVDETVIIDVPIVFGTPTTWTFQVRLGAGISVQFDDCLTCGALFSGRSDADFGSTGELVDVQLFDGAGNELDPSLIQAESGFRYDLVGDDVPAPSGIAWGAVAGLWWMRRVAVSKRCGTRGPPPAPSGGWIGCCADVSGPGSERQ